MASSNLLHDWKAIGQHEEEVLEKTYAKTREPSASVKLDLALELHVSPQNIGRWFSARKRRDQGEQRASRKAPEQLEVLERYFSRNPFPTREEKAAICKETGCSLRQINSWFQHSRKKRNMTNLDNLPGEYLRSWHQQAAQHIRSAIDGGNGRDAGEGGDSENEDESHGSTSFDSAGATDSLRGTPPSGISLAPRERPFNPDDDSTPRPSHQRLSGSTVHSGISTRYNSHQDDEDFSPKSQGRHQRHVSSASIRSIASIDSGSTRVVPFTEATPFELQRHSTGGPRVSHPSSQEAQPNFAAFGSTLGGQGRTSRTSESSEEGQERRTSNPSQLFRISPGQQLRQFAMDSPARSEGDGSIYDQVDDTRSNMERVHVARAAMNSSPPPHLMAQMPSQSQEQADASSQLVGFMDNLGNCYSLPSNPEVQHIGNNHAIIPLAKTLSRPGQATPQYQQQQAPPRSTSAMSAYGASPHMHLQWSSTPDQAGLIPLHAAGSQPSGSRGFQQPPNRMQSGFPATSQMSAAGGAHGFVLSRRTSQPELRTSQAELPQNLRSAPTTSQFTQPQQQIAQVAFPYFGTPAMPSVVLPQQLNANQQQWQQPRFPDLTSQPGFVSQQAAYAAAFQQPGMQMTQPWPFLQQLQPQNPQGAMQHVPMVQQQFYHPGGPAFGGPAIPAGTYAVLVPQQQQKQMHQQAMPQTHPQRSTR